VDLRNPLSWLNIYFGPVVILEQGVDPLSLPFAAFCCFAQRLYGVEFRRAQLGENPRCATWTVISYFPHLGDSSGFAVELPLGCNWNSFLNC
jgi:hypothetical protein